MCTETKKYPTEFFLKVGFQETDFWLNVFTAQNYILENCLAPTCPKKYRNNLTTQLNVSIHMCDLPKIKYTES